jgi:transposase
MVKNGEHFMIKEMQQKGMSVTRIAEELGRDRKTIRKWLQEEEVRSYQRSIIKKSLLEPFKSYVKERMEEGCVNAVVLFDEIKTRTKAMRGNDPAPVFYESATSSGDSKGDRAL